MASPAGSTGKEGPLLSTQHQTEKCHSITPATKQLCTVCQKMTAVRCSHCKAPYCSRKCQTEDWPVHRQSCRRLDGSQNSNSVSSSSGSTGSGDRVNSDGGEKKDASLTTQHQTEKCDSPTAKHVTFGPSLQPTPSNPDEGVMVPFSHTSPLHPTTSCLP